MSRHMLLALLIAVATIFAPLGMSAGQAAAAQPGEMTNADHCDPQSSPDHGDHDGKMVGHGCCAAMCVGMVVPAEAGDPIDHHPRAERPASDPFRRGYLGEIATPPPRLA